MKLTMVLHAKKVIIMARVVNLAYYRKEDWGKLLESVDDRKSMHDTWRQWNKAYLKLKSKLTSEGFIVKDFIVDLDELIAYCALRGIKMMEKHDHNL